MVQFASYLRRVLAKTRLIFSRIKGPTEFLRTPGSNTRNNAAKIYWTKNVEKGCEMYHGKLEKLNILQQNKTTKSLSDQNHLTFSFIIRKYVL